MIARSENCTEKLSGAICPDDKDGNRLDYNGCLSQLQTYLQNSPLIVLGSGASIPCGLPSMHDLSIEIEKHKRDMTDNNFDTFCSLLPTVGLENALDQVSLTKDTHDKIRQVVWEYVNEKDIEFLSKNFKQNQMPLSKLINKVLQAAPNKVTIVTTNYDRLAEYATDQINATAITGFEGSFIRKMEFPSSTVVKRRTKARERQVEIWKVHGSLDWFKGDNDNIISFPLAKSIPDSHTPLIIPPGKDKYRNTYMEPFRSVIAQSDVAFSQPGAYLCVGYGFNDEHIQPKLIAEIEKGRPIVVIAKNITDACRNLVIGTKTSKYLVFESAGDGKTRAYGKGWSEEYDGEFWQLDEFMKVW